MTDFLIEYDGLSVALDKFLSGSRPRTRLRTPELSHSNAGTPITDGVSYEPLHLWDTIECLIDPTQRQALDRIYARHLVDRLPFTLHDYSQVLLSILELEPDRWRPGQPPQLTAAIFGTLHSLTYGPITRQSTDWRVGTTR